MSTNPTIPSSIRNPEKPSDFKGELAAFSEGKLCFVVARRHQGEGPVRLILHEATPLPQGQGFGYGDKPRHWVIGAGTLMGFSRSERKSAQARLNGSRPKKQPNVGSPHQTFASATTISPKKSPTPPSATTTRAPLLKPSGKLT